MHALTQAGVQNLDMLCGRSGSASSRLAPGACLPTCAYATDVGGVAQVYVPPRRLLPLVPAPEGCC